MTKRRVVVRGTGTIGSVGLRLIIEHPDLELVGLLVSSPAKVGLDAGEIAGTAPTGVIATDDVESVLVLQADCLAHFGNSAMREEANNAEMIPFLLRGTNVVTTSNMDIFQPRHGRPEFVEPIARACMEGGSSIFSSGVDPGFCTTGFVFNLLQIAGRVDRIHLYEIADLSEYPSVDTLKLYGFGEPLDYKPPMFTGPIGRSWHESTIRCMADYFGVAIDRISSEWDTAALDFDIEPAFGPIPAGRTVATRWTMEAFSGDVPFIRYTKLERLHKDAAPHWQQGKVGNGEEAFWRVDILGEPDYTAEIGVKLVPGIAVTPAHPVNAIPVVCDAPPGIVDPLKLPAFFSTNLGEGLRRTA